MKKLKESQRIQQIESKWNKLIEDLLYEWHWQNNLQHKEIGRKLHIPRSTITRWFKQFQIPTQSCSRFTNNNLLYVGQNCPPKKPKQPKKTKEKIPVNKTFFRNWSPKMAYVLGYFVADGCMFINPRGSYYITFSSTDRELITQVREVINSKHRIGIQQNKNPNWKTKYSLQIGSKLMFQDLINLKMTPNKSNNLSLPKIPKEYFCHFVRGYFDGDGCVFFKKYQRRNRKNPVWIAITAFTSGSKQFLIDLFESLKQNSNLKGGYLCKKNYGFELRFSMNDSIELYNLMYNNTESNLFLKRKYNVFQKILSHKGT